MVSFINSFRQILNKILNFDQNAINIRVTDTEQLLIDNYSSSVSYQGKAIDSDSLDSESVWQIKRTVRNGNIYKTIFANNGAYNNKWSERYSIFPGFVSSNNYSLSLDGVNDYLTGGNILNYDHATAFSISLWVNPQNLTAQRALFSKAGTDANVRGFALYHEAAGALFLQLRSSGANTGFTFTTTLTAGVWQHVVFTYSGNSNINGSRVYKNSAIGNTPTSGALSGTWLESQNFLIAARGSGFYFSGKIDEITVWNKALSQGEVGELYNLGAPTVPSEHSASSNLVNYWRMGDGDSFPTILDNKGSNNLTMTNMNAGSIVEDVP